jgi:photosystem II stability/assembly factor-like uncharacterized protein
MDELIRSRIHDALDVVQPDGALRARVIDSLPAEVSRARRVRGLSFDWAVGAVAVLLAVAVVAALLYTRPSRPPMPGAPGAHAWAQGGIAMVTPTIGWEVGPAARVLRTTDGALHWKDVTPADYASNSIDSYFLDANHAWITELDRSSSSTIVFGTDDGGTSWRRSQPLGVAGLHRTFGTTLYFIDRTHGWLLIPGLVAGSVLADASTSTQVEALYRTTDGGAHWQQLSQTTSAPGACAWGDVVFSAPATGWITNFCPSGIGPALLVSHDGGVTWNAQSLPVPASSLETAPLFFDSLHGNLVTSDGLLVTTDGGQTWSVRALPGATQTSVDFVDAAHGWAIGGSDALLNPGSNAYGVVAPLFRTDDGGNTWLPVRSNLMLVSAYGRVQRLIFVDQRHGFATAVTAVPVYGAFAYQGTLLKTVDGGVTWTAAGKLP